MRGSWCVVRWILAIVICSCENETIAKFEIENKTGITIDSLRIVPNGYESDYYISLTPGELKKYDCNMTDIADSDEDYRLNYKFDTSLFVTKTFGYYTNGYPIESLIRVSIKPDTILFDLELNRY